MWGIGMVSGVVKRERPASGPGSSSEAKPMREVGTGEAGARSHTGAVSGGP